MKKPTISQLPPTKELRAEGDKNRSNSWRVVDALSDAPEWHVIHLEFANSGRTGKFYRVYLCDQSSGGAVTHWGARPVGVDLDGYGDRGQYKPTDARKARELLRAKIDKGYYVVAEGTFRAEKNFTGSQLAQAFDRLVRENAISFPARPQWRGWQYY